MSKIVHTTERVQGVPINALRGQHIRLVWWPGEPTALLVFDLGIDEVRLSLSAEALEELRGIVGHRQYGQVEKVTKKHGPAFTPVDRG